MAKTNGKPTPSEADVLRQLIRDAHEAIKGLRELHRDHVAEINALTDAFQAAQRLAQEDVAKLIIDDTRQVLERHLSREVSSITEHVTNTRRGLDRSFASVTAAWLDVLIASAHESNLMLPGSIVAPRKLKALKHAIETTLSATADGQIIDGPLLAQCSDELTRILADLPND